MIRALLLLAVTALLGSCDRAPRSNLMRVGIIGPGATPFDLAIRTATGRGLVRLDASGQVIPDLAARWAIVDDGLDYIFRLDDGVAPKTVARRLRALLATRGNPLRAWLTPVARIDAVTATVIEIRLSSPMPDLLSLLARPEMTLGDYPGPMRALTSAPRIATLTTPANDPERLSLAAESAGRAVARFMAGRADVVLGGSFADLPVALAASLPEATLVRDPAAGLFGFAARSTRGPAANLAVMHALAQAIDRDRIAALLGAQKATTIGGSILEAPLTERIVTARQPIPAPIAIRVAMPDGPGAGLLFKLVAQDWRRVGVAATLVTADAPADLALIDLVVPPGEVARIACVVSAGCDQRDPLALLDPTFIPLIQPVRWSLVVPTIDGFVANPLAAHPLDQLRRAR